MTMIKIKPMEEKDLETLLKEKKAKDVSDCQQAIQEALERFKCDLLPKIMIAGNNIQSVIEVINK